MQLPPGKGGQCKGCCFTDDHLGPLIVRHISCSDQVSAGNQQDRYRCTGGKDGKASAKLTHGARPFPRDQQKCRGQRCAAAKQDQIGAADPGRDSISLFLSTLHIFVYIRSRSHLLRLLDAQTGEILQRMEKNLSDKLELGALSVKHQFIAYCQSCIEKKHLVEVTGSQGGKVDSIAFPPLAEIVHRIIAFRWVRIHIR